MKLVILLFLGLFSQVSIAETNQVELKIWNRSFKWNEKLTKEILNLTVSEFGPATLIASTELEQGRAEKETALDRMVNIIIFPTTKEREKELLPIRIPIMAGLMGWRVCLIHKKNEENFSKIKTLEAWKKSGLSIGQGTHWPDKAILEANGLHVVHATNYIQVKKMFIHKRFDCFARGLAEVSGELKELASQGIAIEKNLLFHYPMPQYFFVSRKRPKLAERIELGLRKLIEKNRLTEFNSFDPAQIKKISKGRTLIKLTNPNISSLTEKTFGDKAIWIDPRR